MNSSHLSGILWIVYLVKVLIIYLFTRQIQHHWIKLVFALQFIYNPNEMDLFKLGPMIWPMDSRHIQFTVDVWTNLFKFELEFHCLNFIQDRFVT